VPVDPALQANIDLVRDHVGDDDPDDLAIVDALTRTEVDDTASPLRAALSILKRRRADLIAAAGKLSVDQDYSREITKVQLDFLAGQITEVERLIAVEDGDDAGDTVLPDVTVATLSPTDVDRVDTDDLLMAELGGPIVIRW
jgi:hypothetical protein